MKLRFQISSGLGSKRWIARSDTCAVFSMATGTGFQPAFLIAMLIQLRSRAILFLRHTARTGRDRQTGIVTRDLLAGRPVQVIGDPSHLIMPPSAIGEIVQLPHEVTRIEASQSR